MFKWDLSDHELFNMFVVYNDLNNKCGPYTSSNRLQLRDIPWYSAPFFTCWNQTWYAQLNLSHAIPSINMDIFMGNLARQAVALPKRLTPTHLSQTFTTRCHDISAVSAVSDGLSACARRSSCSSSSSAAKRWNSNSWPRWDVPRLPRVKLHGSGSWLKRLWSSPPAIGIPYYGYIPVGVWSGSSIWKQTVFGPHDMSALAQKIQNPFPALIYLKYMLPIVWKEKTRWHQTTPTNLFPVLVL